MIDVGSIGQEYIGKSALELVLAVSLGGHVYAEGGGRRGLLCSLAVGLASLRDSRAAETDAFSVVAIQYFDGVAVEDRDDPADRKPKTCQFSLQRIRYARFR